MSIDALVFCDCLERGALRRPPRTEWQVYVQSDGCRECAAADHCAMGAFGLWHETACHHDYGILLHRTLASAETMARFKEITVASGCRCPVLEGRVLAHQPGRDEALEPAAVDNLALELQALREAVGQWPAEIEGMVRALEDLVACARQVNKPLVL